MKVLIVLGFCLATALAVPFDQSPAITLKELFETTFSFDRIISGQPAARGQLPWQVSVQGHSPQGSWFCGGSLISNEWVLTAAHCVEGATSFTLGLGGLTPTSQEDGKIIVTSSTFVMHSGYNSFLNNDVGVIRLPNPVTFTDNIRAIRLPSSGETLGAGVSVTISGWGRTSDSSSSISQVLNYVQVTTITNQQCAAVYGNAVIIYSTLCAVGNPEHSTCNGDSGGPLVHYNNDGVATLHGVVSFVHVNGCASGNPSGYVRTEALLSWISQQTGVSI